MWDPIAGASSTRSRTKPSEGDVTVNRERVVLTETKVPCDVQVAASVLEDHKASDVVVLDLRGISGATDYFIIASGSSDIHVRALGQRVIEGLAEQRVRPHHAEGIGTGRWVLLDFVDFVVHVFHPELREFYQLERLWGDAPLVFRGLVESAELA